MRWLKKLWDILKDNFLYDLLKSALLTVPFAAIMAYLNAPITFQMALIILAILLVIALLNQIFVRRPTAIRGSQSESTSIPKPSIPLSPPEELKDIYIQDRNFRITDLVRDNNVKLQQRIFRKCNIYGPGMMMLLPGTVITRCTFNHPGNVDAILYEMSESRIAFVGIIGFAQCTFIECGFFGIGIAGPSKVLEMIKTDLLRKG